MPIYEYRCAECEQIFEEWQKDFEEREVPCPVCGNKSPRLMSNTTFVLKGSGWYVTDYCNGRNASAHNGGNGSGNGDSNGNGDSGGDAKASSDDSGGSPPKKAETGTAKAESTVA